MSSAKKTTKAEKAPVAKPAVNAEQGPTIAGKEQSQSTDEVPPTKQEVEMFAVYEDTIKQNIGGFMKVGKALKAIQTQKLHRVAKFDSFEDYCRDRWGLSRQYAYRLIYASTCVENLQKALSPNGENVQLPTHESQVRSMASEDPEIQVKTWQQVLKVRKGKSITADEVERVVKKVLGQPGTEKTTSSKTKSKEAEQKLMKIHKLVSKALKDDDSEPSVTKLRQILERIKKLLGSKE